jgi:very-short-patch-repair endonuclease
MLADRAGQTSAGGSRSELELWPVLKRTGLDGLAQQHEVWIDGVRYFLDYALPALKIAIEYDPFETHARTSQCG